MSLDKFKLGDSISKYYEKLNQLISGVNSNADAVKEHEEVLRFINNEIFNKLSRKPYFFDTKLSMSNCEYLEDSNCCFVFGSSFFHDGKMRVYYVTTDPSGVSADVEIIPLQNGLNAVNIPPEDGGIDIEEIIRTLDSRMDAALGNKADKVHTHVPSDVIGLDTTLSSKEPIVAKGTTTGTGSALVLTVPANYGFTLVDGAIVRIKLHTELVPPSTLNVNSTGAKSLATPSSNTNIKANAGSWLTFIYNGANFILQGEGEVKKGGGSGLYGNTPGQMSSFESFAMGILPAYRKDVF